MAGLRASQSSINLPAYCLASFVADDDSLQLQRSKNFVFHPAFELASADACLEEGFDDLVHHPEKKRRLIPEQVSALEKNFEMENKLDPERKMQIACELGLQPRQVAVWFQNKRARQKAKKLEIVYDNLKLEYLSLKGKYDTLLKEHERIQAEMVTLKATLQLVSNQSYQTSEERGMMEQLKLNGAATPTLDPQMLKDGSTAGKLRMGVSIEEELTRAMCDEGSSMSNAEASEVSNTNSPRCLGESKVCKVNYDISTAAASAATCVLISNFNSNAHQKAFPPLLCESFFKKVQAAAMKFEPENMPCETICCNFSGQASEGSDAPWWECWDLDYSNFCT